MEPRPHLNHQLIKNSLEKKNKSKETKDRNSCKQDHQSNEALSWLKMKCGVMMANGTDKKTRFIKQNMKNWKKKKTKNITSDN